MPQLRGCEVRNDGQAEAMSLKTAVSNWCLNRDDLRICDYTVSHSRSLVALQGVRHNRADREAVDRAPTQRADRLLGDGHDLPS